MVLEVLNTLYHYLFHSGNEEALFLSHQQDQAGPLAPGSSSRLELSLKAPCCLHCLPCAHCEEEGSADEHT